MPFSDESLAGQVADLERRVRANEGGATVRATLLVNYGETPRTTAGELVEPSMSTHEMLMAVLLYYEDDHSE